MAAASVRPLTGSRASSRPFRNVSVMGIAVALGLVAYYAVVFVFPFYRAIWLSFHNWDFIVDPVPVGFRNYERAFREEYFWKALRVTVMFSVAEIVAGILASFLVSLGISQLKNGKLQRAFLGVFYLPVVIPSIVTVLLWRFLYLPSGGAFNSVLERLGIPAQPFLNSPDQALWCIVLMVVWANLGGSAIIFFAGINEVSTDLLEASRLDGAGLWRQTIDVIVPIMRPIFFYQIVVSVIGTVQMFEQFYLLSGPAFSTRTLAVYTYELGFKTLNLGYGAAVSILIFLLLLIATIVQFRQFLAARSE
ncbi:MAG TPA: sugar ABC transporter permease [Thermomicrobiales bacterium]|nr:sugar ABC transporter permease [Thermomicrobiales bacterium]